VLFYLLKVSWIGKFTGKRQKAEKKVTSGLGKEEREELFNKIGTECRGPASHAYKSSYLGGWDWEERGSDKTTSPEDAM
jgi:hypothetical protein